MTDSRVSLKPLKIVKVLSKLILNCRHSLHALAEHNKNIVEWVLRHEGLLKRRLLARKRAKEILIGPEPTCCILDHMLKELVKENTINSDWNFFAEQNFVTKKINC